MTQKTFKDFGLTFEFDETCATCFEGNCHNKVTSKKDGKEYNVHISTNKEFTKFAIYATETTNVDDSNSIEKDFDNEEEAVKFVCDNFEWFKCF